MTEELAKMIHSAIEGISEIDNACGTVTLIGEVTNACAIPKVETWIKIEVGESEFILSISKIK